MHIQKNASEKVAATSHKMTKYYVYTTPAILTKFDT